MTDHETARTIGLSDDGDGHALAQVASEQRACLTLTRPSDTLPFDKKRGFNSLFPLQIPHSPRSGAHIHAAPALGVAHEEGLMVNSLKWSVSAFFLASGLAFWTGGAQAQGTIKIMYTDPLSGPFAQVGDQNLKQL